MSSRAIETIIDISAPIEHAWRVLTDFPSYPQWSRFIVSIDGMPSAGSQLSVYLDDGAGAMQIRPEVLLCEPYELRWRGTLGGRFLFSGEHSFRFESLPDGGTRMTHSEVFGGILVPLLWRRLNTSTRQALHAFNTALRQQAENVPW